MTRKQCPKCSAYYVMSKDIDIHSCEQCGNGYLKMLPDLKETPDAKLPRSGGGTITHSRDSF